MCAKIPYICLKLCESVILGLVRSWNIIISIQRHQTRHLRFRRTPNIAPFSVFMFQTQNSFPRFTFAVSIQATRFSFGGYSLCHVNSIVRVYRINQLRDYSFRHHLPSWKKPVSLICLSNCWNTMMNLLKTIIYYCHIQPLFELFHHIHIHVLHIIKLMYIFLPLPSLDFFLFQVWQPPVSSYLNNNV